MQKPDYVTAILSLSPNACFSLEDPTNLTTLSWATPKTNMPSDVPFVGAVIEQIDFLMPSINEIETELNRLTVEYNYFLYQRERIYQYPSIGDQLDALYHAGVFPEEMTAQIKAVKDLYPKPIEGGV
jgi:hypothetical protein